MDFIKIKIFVRVCFWYASNGYLNLDNRQLICLYKECLAMAYYLKDTLIQMFGCHLIGVLYQSMYQYTEAIHYHERCLQIATKEGNKEDEAAAYCNLGTVHQLLAKYHEAIHYFKKYLDIALVIKDKKMEGKAYSNLGSAYLSLAKYNEAIHYLKKSLEITVEEGDKELECATNRHLGSTYLVLAKYHEAIDCLEKSLKIALEMGDKNNEAAAYNYLGWVCHALAKHDDAIMYAEKTLKIALDMGNRIGEQHSYGLFGAIFHSLGNFHKSMKYHEKSLNISIEIGDKSGEGSAYEKLGLAYQSLSKYDESIKNHEKNLSIAIEIGKRNREGAAYGNLGNVYSLLGEHHEAIEYHKKHLKISKEIGDKSGEGRANTNLGGTYRSLGKYNEAIKYFENSLQIATDIGDKYAEGCAYSNLGGNYTAVGKYDDAIKYLEKQLKISIESGEKNGEGIAYLNLATVYQELGKYTDSIMHFKKCKIIFTETGNKDCEAVVYRKLGSAYYLLGKDHESIKYHERSLLIAKEIGSKIIEGSAYGGLGQAYMSLHKYDEAIKYHQKCLEISLQTGEKAEEASANHYLGSSYIGLADYHFKHNAEENLNCFRKAENYLRDGVICYEWLFDHLQDQDQFKISIVDTYIKTYKLLTAVLIDSLKADEALLMSERGRARALGDLLMLKYDMTRGNDATNNCLTNADIEAILSNRKFCVLFFAMASDTNVVTWHLSHYNKSHHLEPIQGFNSTTHDSLFKKDQEDRVEAYLNQVVKASYDNMKVREGMNCEDRSLELLENKHNDVVNAKGQSFVKGKSSKATENDYPKSMTQNPEADRCIRDEELDNIDPLRILFDGLVAPVKCIHCPQHELVIVPFGPLYTVPFAALRDPNTGIFLSETKRIRLAPSLTALKALQNSPANYHSKTGALIIGNPNVGEVMFRGTKTQFQNLPCAEKEAEMISKLLGVKPFIGPQATKEVIKQSLQENVAVIHFAAHGTTEGEIALTPCVTSSIPEEQDYILTMKEVQESGVRPQLVVLSCCHSGRGEIKAEGVVGMSRAFLAAGARAVVASLWAIADEATMIFMEKFYSHLSRGESASVSLQQAMREMRKTDRYSEPKYWAAFFLIGDDVTISCGGNGS